MLLIGSSHFSILGSLRSASRCVCTYVTACCMLLKKSVAVRLMVGARVVYIYINIQQYIYILVFEVQL